MRVEKLGGSPFRLGVGGAVALGIVAACSARHDEIDGASICRSRATGESATMSLTVSSAQGRLSLERSVSGVEVAARITKQCGPFCCPAGAVCANPAGATLADACCPNDRVVCAGQCCDPGQQCFSDPLTGPRCGVCPTSVCGKFPGPAVCCPQTQDCANFSQGLCCLTKTICTNGTCCNGNETCLTGNLCCPDWQALKSYLTGTTTCCTTNVGVPCGGTCCDDPNKKVCAGTGCIP